MAPVKERKKKQNHIFLFVQIGNNKTVMAHLYYDENIISVFLR